MACTFTLKQTSWKILRSLNISLNVTQKKVYTYVNGTCHSLIKGLYLCEWYMPLFDQRFIPMWMVYATLWSKVYTYVNGICHSLIKCLYLCEWYMPLFDQMFIPMWMVHATLWSKVYTYVNGTWHSLIKGNSKLRLQFHSELNFFSAYYSNN